MIQIDIDSITDIRYYQSTMTTKQIRQALRAAGKPVQIAQLYRYFKAFSISPLPFRQRPQQYPEDAPNRILSNLGLACAAPKRSKPNTARRPALPTMETLRRAKLKAK